MMVMQIKTKKWEKKNRYLLVKKMYTKVKNEAHQNDPQLRMPCKKPNAYLFIRLFLKWKQEGNAHHNKNAEERKYKIKRVKIKPKYPKPSTQTLNKEIELEQDF